MTLVRRLRLRGEVDREGGKKVSEYHSWPLGVPYLQVYDMIVSYHRRFKNVEFETEMMTD